MKNLILTLLATSSVDSLNPIGITQQFILQGMVKKPRHIWYFILTTGVVNMIFGYLVYYGVITVLNNGLSSFLDSHAFLINILKCVLGCILLFFGIRLLVKEISEKKQNEYEKTTEKEEKQIQSRIWSVTPLALIVIGVISTASELTSALPYFVFLSVLVTYNLSFHILTLILIFYNIIYMAPFMLLYFIYVTSKQRFDNIYNFFKKHLKKISEFIIPIVLLLASIFLIVNSTIKIINLG